MPVAGEDFDLWPENAEAFELFLAVQSQWRMVAAMSAAVYVGLDYQGVEAAMRMRRVRVADRARLLAELQDMERAALPILNRTHG